MLRLVWRALRAVGRALRWCFRRRRRRRRRRIPPEVEAARVLAQLQQLDRDLGFQRYRRR